MKRIIKFSIIALIYSVACTAFLNGSSVYAQSAQPAQPAKPAKPEKRTIEARTLCLRRAADKPDVFINGLEGPYKILLPVQTFSHTFECVLEDGVARFFKEEGTLPNGKPKRIVVAQTKVKSDIKKALFFFDVSTPTGKGKGKGTGKAKRNKLYNVIALDDGEQKFPLGQARVLNLFNADIIIRIGEHRKLMKPRSIRIIPAAKKRSSSNMVNIVGKIQLKDKQWATFSEFKSRFTNEIRIFIISYYDTASGQPKLKVYKDIPMAKEPGRPAE